MLQRSNRSTGRDDAPDPIDELSLDDEGWRDRFGVTGSIDSAVDNLARHTLGRLNRQRTLTRLVLV